MPARTPDRVEAAAPHALEPAHHLVDVGQVIGDMVEAGRTRQKGDPVMGAVAADQAHEIADPVAQAESQRVNEPLGDFLVLR